MRFSLAHKLTTYLMVVCSYLALVLSGELGLTWAAASLVGIVVSWFWEPPRIRWERWGRVWSAVSLGVLGYSLLDLFFGGDFLIIGAHFLLYLLVAKLFNRRACKDYQQLYILTFLMLVSGTVLNAEITYGVFFLGYVVAATWALILFHLRREMEDNFLLKHSDGASSERVQVARILNSRRIVGGRFFLGTSVVSLTIFAGATLLFLMIPRIGFGLFFSKSRSGVTMAGFSDGVQLGGHGVIKDDDTVVMRVKVSQPYQGRGAPYVHWRGVAFDRYEHGRWRRSKQAPETRRRITVAPGAIRHHLLYDQKLSDAELAARLEHAVRQEIYLEPLGYDVLFGASMPLAFEFESRWGHRAKPDRNDEIRREHSTGVRYVVYSDPAPPTAEELRRAPEKPLPEGYDVYLQIPEEIPNDVIELARKITRGAKTPYDKAVAVQSWLKDNLDYTLKMRSPGGDEPIHYFLFERRKGHCEYFSSAMAIMLRAVGVPTRNVNGFLGGEWNEYDDYIAVRAGDAHSWVEVYFPGHGWVTFDPTPSASIDRLGRGGGGLLDRLRRMADTLRFKWFKWVIEYDLYRQLKLFKKLGGLLRGGPGGFLSSRTSRARDWIGRHRASAIGGGVAALLLGVAIALWLRRRHRTLGAGPVAGRRRSRDPIAILYRSVQARLARRGYRRAPATTPREHARALARSRAPGAGPLAELTELYYAAEYGGDGGEEALARARELRDEIERELKEKSQ